MSQDETDRSEVDRLREEVAEARHHLVTVQTTSWGSRPRTAGSTRPQLRVTMELRRQRKRTNNLGRQRDDARARLADYGRAWSATAPASPRSSAADRRRRVASPGGSAGRSGEPSGPPAPRFSIVTPVYDPPVDVLKACIESVLAQELRRLGADPGRRLLARRRRADGHPRSTPQEDPRIRADRARHQRPHRRRLQRRRRRRDGASSSRCSTTTTCSPPTPCRGSPRRSTATTTSTTSTPTRTRSTTTARATAPSTSPTGRPSGCAARCTPRHLSVLRTELVREVGGFREGFDGSQDHDLVLRVTERARRVVHVPEVLYHWRAVAGLGRGRHRGQALRRRRPGSRAVQEHLDRLGIDATVSSGAEPGSYTVERRLDPAVAVSRGHPDDGPVGGGLRACGACWSSRPCAPLLERTDHADVEVVVVHDTPTPGDGPRRAPRDRRRPAGARALRRAVQLQREDEPRRLPRLGRPRRVPQRRRRGDLARAGWSSWSPRSTSPTSA